MRPTFSWKWVVISVIAFAPVRLLWSHTDLPAAMIWGVTGFILVLLLLLKLAMSIGDPANCDHRWYPAPQGWACPRCDGVRRTSGRPPDGR